jgi:nucleoside 2-deoxyribosyltransferase
MRIYFSCSITGGRSEQPVYAALVSHLQAKGHTVLTAHLANSDLQGQESGMDPETVYQRDIAWVKACDVLIAEVSTPSHGVGYEIAYALGRSKPVLGCFRRGAIVSRMLTGNREPGMVVSSYLDVPALLAAADAFLESYGTL